MCLYIFLYAVGIHLFITHINLGEGVGVKIFLDPYFSIPNGYGIRWSLTSNPNLFTSSTAMRFILDRDSNKTSIFVFSNFIFIKKSLFFSFSSCYWRLLKFIPFYTNLQTIFSSMFELFSSLLLNMWPWYFSSSHPPCGYFGWVQVSYKFPNISLQHNPNFTI